MKPPFIIAAGVTWTAVAVGIAVAFGLPIQDAIPGIPRFLIAGIATSYAVTYLFRCHLVFPDVQKKRWMPFATIPAGVGIWSTLLFCGAAVSSLIGGRQDLFDGYSFFLIAGLPDYAYRCTSDHLSVGLCHAATDRSLCYHEESLTKCDSERRGTSSMFGMK